MIKSASQSSLTSNIKYRSMSAGSVPSSEYLITSTVLTQNEPSITFDVSGLSAQFRHLVLCMTIRSTYANYPVFDTGMRFNGDSAANYSFHQLLGLGSGSALSETGTNQTSMRCGVGAANSLGSSIFGASTVEILDAFSSTKNKTIRSLDGTMGGATNGNYVMLHSGSWRNTASITSITLIDQYGGNFVTGSRFSLYGVTA